MSASPAAVKSYLPQSVRAQVARADALIAGLQPGAPAPAAPAAPAPQNTPNPVDPTAVAAPPAAAPLTLEQTVADWEHKYKVLQGKYNAEVPRMQNQIRESEQLLRDMRQQLTNTQTMLASLGNGQPAQNVAPPAQPAQRRVKDEEIKAFGPDLFDFIKRASLEAVEPELARVARPIEQRLSKTEQAATTAANTVNASAVERLYALLVEQVPDWEQLNEDRSPDGFLAWLGQRDPYAGVPREQLLAQAYEAHDGPRVVAFFKGFKNENALVTGQPVTAPAETAPAAQQESQMLQLVAPGTPKAGPSSGAPNDAGKRVWTRPDVQALYAKINEFTKKGKQPPAELRTLEADLIRAQSEGRVRA